MCVGDELSRRWYRAFKKRLLCRHGLVLQNKATGVRDGIVDEETAVGVLLIDTISIMVQPMSPVVRGCAEPARRS